MELENENINPNVSNAPPTVEVEKITHPCLPSKLTHAGWEFIFYNFLNPIFLILISIGNSSTIKDRRVSEEIAPTIIL